jgi:hypothetical protein
VGQASAVHEVNDDRAGLSHEPQLNKGMHAHQPAQTIVWSVGLWRTLSQE